MITIDDFRKMSDKEKCTLVNKQFETCNTRTFKNGEINFTWSQADKVLKETSITKVDGKYMTAEEAFSHLEEKEKKQQAKELTDEDIIQIKQLLDKDTFDKLIKLASSYNYVANYILKSDTGVQIREASGNIKTTSMRIYDDVLEDWQKFVGKHKQYTALDLLSTALQEYMDRH